MIIGVFGPRDHKGARFKDYNRVCDILDTYEGATEYVTGGGEGVEQMALRYAEERRIPNDTVPPNINAFGAKEAFKRRNEEIMRRIDFAVVLWDGVDAYTGELISKLITHVPVHVFHVERPNKS